MIILIRINAHDLVQQAAKGVFMSETADWRSKAACRDKDPELFFHVGNTSAAYQQVEEAKTVCNNCSVVKDCLKCAIEHNEDYGVWGGLSEDERRSLKRRHRHMHHKQG